MGEGTRIHIGLAGWSNPADVAAARGIAQSHLSPYATRFSCVEINSSFHKPHQASTYRRWRDDTPESFRFAVKMPRSITHDSALRRCQQEVERFYVEISQLQPKLSVVLVQLPPSLEFSARTVRTFFTGLPRKRGVRVTCEPRHASWFTDAADSALKDLNVARVAADPARHPGADLPGGSSRLAYFRWHGSPRMYYSAYSATQLEAFAVAVAGTRSKEIWCIFDNTAQQAAWQDALQFMALTLPPADGLFRAQARSKHGPLP